VKLSIPLLKLSKRVSHEGNRLTLVGLVSRPTNFRIGIMGWETTHHSEKCFCGRGTINLDEPKRRLAEPIRVNTAGPPLLRLQKGLVV
jgi:hypothetical protein